MNRIPNTGALANRYFVLRHGHSLANERGIIVSRPENGCGSYGLSDLGRRQVAESIGAAAGLDRSTLVVSSDFSRALESARIAHELLACEMPLRTDERLRERDFGAFELCSNREYQRVWARDAQNPDGEYYGVESASRVMRRVTSLIADLETEIGGATYLLVSHGDCLQLLQTAFCRQDASRHRCLAHLKTAEIRQLRLA